MSSCQLMFPGVRSRSRENPMPKGQRTRGVTPRPRSGAVAESARLRQRRNSREELPCVRGLGRQQEELPRVKGQGWWLGGAIPCPQAQGQGRRPGGPTPCPRSHGCAGAGGPRGAIQWKGGGEEIPLLQGKEQRLCFAGAAVKRYPMSKVRETQVRR